MCPVHSVTYVPGLDPCRLFPVTVTVAASGSGTVLAWRWAGMSVSSPSLFLASSIPARL
jgi:hypothetical protein